MATKNKDGLPIKEGQNVGLTAGMAKDERTTLHDKAIPETIEATWTDPEDATRSEKRPFNLRESHDYHERIERALMDAGMVYDDGHRWATEVEHARQRQMGFDPNEIEELAKPFIDMAAHRAKAEGARAPAALDEKPYVDNGDEDLLNRPAIGYEHSIYDRDGNRYTNPRQLRLLDTFDAFVGCNDADGTYAVIEPGTGMLLSHGHELDDQATKAAEALASRRGSIFLRRMIDMEPPLSQQQRKEKYDARNKSQAASEVRGDQEVGDQERETSEDGEADRVGDLQQAAEAGAEAGDR